MELGLYSFAELHPDPATGQKISQQQRAAFDAQCDPRGALFVGSPAEVVDKVLFEHDIFKHDRFLLQIGVGALDHGKAMRSIELFGTRVAPEVRKALMSRVAPDRITRIS